MAAKMKPCCEKTLEEARLRFEKLATSYPVIKEFPCPVCRQVLPLRIYGPPEEEQETPNA
jgi:hypothetical protein